MKIKDLKQMMLALCAVLSLVVANGNAQPITLSGTNYLQNFDSLSGGLPNEWVLYTGASAITLGTISTTFFAAVSSTNNWASTTGGFKNYSSVTNYGAGTNFVGNEATAIQTNSSNRALGVRPVSATDAGNAFVLKLANTTGYGKFKIDLDMLLLNVQNRSMAWNMDFGISSDGSSPPTSFTVLSNAFYTALSSNTTPVGTFGSTHIKVDAGALLDNQPGPIFIRIWNSATTGSGSRPSVAVDNFSLTFTNYVAPPTPPAITTAPQSKTVYIGDAVTLTVANSGTAPFTYQWYKNDFSTPVGNGTANLLFPAITADDAGNYYVVVSNVAGSTTNNPSATLTVGIRIPINTTIYNLRTNQDVVNWSPIDTTNFYTVTGVVISRTNMTTSANASFYIEDTNSLSGLDVFIAGDTSTRPSFGDTIQVTGPLGQFNGMLEFNLNSANPTHIVYNLGPSGYVVPAKPFNFATGSNVPFMETNAEGSLIMVSGVYIQNGGTGSNFVSGATMNLTNQSGQTFTLFIDSRLGDIIGQPIPAGPVSISGYMAQFKSAAPFTSGYQIVPTFAGGIVVTPVPIPLTGTKNTAGLVLSWTDASFALQSATNVAGPYQTVSGAASPYTNTWSGTQMFFRLVH
jgi:hypothetical protein